MTDSEGGSVIRARDLISNFLDDCVLVIGRSVFLFDEIINLDFYVLDVVLGFLSLSLYLLVHLFEVSTNLVELLLYLSHPLVHHLVELVPLLAYKVLDFIFKLLSPRFLEIFAKFLLIELPKAGLKHLTELLFKYSKYSVFYDLEDSLFVLLPHFWLNFLLHNLDNILLRCLVDYVSSIKQVLV